MNVLFVCNENICRSPIAEALLKKKYAENNIEAIVSSAGFESFNINEPPDPKAIKLARKKNITLDSKARLFLKSDFDLFHRIYVMDTRNYRDVMDLARTEQDRAKVDYLMNVLEPGKNIVIPSPFMRSEVDLNTIFNILDRATDEIVNLAKSN